MKRFQNILVGTDTREDNHPLVDTAADIARHNQAQLTIVDIVPEFGWSIKTLMRDHQHLQELLTSEKSEALQKLAAPLRAEGINVNTVVLHGKSSLAIVHQVLREQHDLVMYVARGSGSRRKSFFGNTAARLLRQCPCPLLLVDRDTKPEFNHVLGCLEIATENDLDDEMNSNIFELASSISHYHEGKFSLLLAWNIWNESMLESRMKPEEVQGMEHHFEAEIRERFDSFLAPRQMNCSDENVHLCKGDPSEVISTFVEENGVDLVVMGTVARSGIYGMIMGNTAEQTLSRLHCSVLALKPASFRCPIALPAE